MATATFQLFFLASAMAGEAAFRASSRVMLAPYGLGICANAFIAKKAASAKPKAVLRTCLRGMNFNFIDLSESLLFVGARKSKVAPQRDIRQAGKSRVGIGLRTAPAVGIDRYGICADDFVNLKVQVRRHSAPEAAGEITRIADRAGALGGNPLVLLRASGAGSDVLTCVALRSFWVRAGAAQYRAAGRVVIRRQVHVHHSISGLVDDGRATSGGVCRYGNNGQHVAGAAGRNSFRAHLVSHAAVDCGIERRSKGEVEVDAWVSVVVKNARAGVVVTLQESCDVGIGIGKQQAFALAGSAL